MNVTGIVKDIRLYDNNFSIVALEAKTPIPKEYAFQWNPSKVIIKGNNIPPLSTGVVVGVEGVWKISDPKYGWFLQVDSIWEEKPKGEEEILAYLSSDLFHNIGPKLSKQIYMTFKDETLNVLEKEPSQLQRVPGIGPKRAVEIGSSFRDSQQKRELFFFLTSFGVTPAKIYKIYSLYDKPMERIKEDPYTIGIDVGLDFSVCDNIAYSLNKPYNDDSRIKHGILQIVCEDACKAGHTFLPKPSLVEHASKRLEQSVYYKGKRIDHLDVLYHIEALVTDGKLVEEKDAIYSSFNYANEVNVATRLRSAMQEKPKKIGDIESKIAAIEASLKVEYGCEQKEAFRKLSDTNVMVITGGPGTGKTTLIKGLIAILKNEFGNSYIVKLCSPTGRAAKRMTEATGHEAQTIHRLLDFVPYGNDLKHKDENDPIDANAIIVDETSMVSIDLASTLLSAVKPGTRLIFLGDTDQLPAVGAGNVLRDMINGGIPTVRLTKVYRQAEQSRIIKNAKRINTGNMELETGEDFRIIETTDAGEIIAAISDEMLSSPDIDDTLTLTPLRRRPPVGVNQLNSVLQSTINPLVPLENESDDELPELRYGRNVFRTRDKVMQFTNNYSLGIFNGDIGIIKKVLASGEIVISVDGRDVALQKSDLDDIDLAYATTVHKSQGSEYGKVIIAFHNEHRSMFSKNLLYTAVTRAKNEIVLVGDKSVIRAAIENTRKEKRYSRLHLRLRSTI